MNPFVAVRMPACHYFVMFRGRNMSIRSTSEKFYHLANMIEKKKLCELWAECFVRLGRVKKDALSLALSEKEVAL